MEETLKEFEIEHLRDKPTYKLSGGEKRIVSVACVVTMKPEVILLDEPTTGLDRNKWKKLADFFERTESSLVVVTHDLELMERLEWKRYVMEGGELYET